MKSNVDNATLRLAIYDPLQLDEQDFLNTFVARHTVLKRLKYHIRENIEKPVLEHRLIFGQRGMGKTSLLRRLALGVRDDRTLAAHWIPLNFREEQYNIGKLDHFWQNCADVLADWCEKQGDIESADDLDKVIFSGENIYGTIRATAEKYSRRLLLLVDNLNLILDSLPVEDQWSLREKLQAKDAPLMIACTPSHVPQLADREGPFYDFFSMDDLTPLTQVEMRECLARLAQTRGEPGQEVLEDMRRYPARIQVMHTLCGGNPRTLVLVYQVLEAIVAASPDDHGDIGQLLEGVLENTTPLYKARTEELPPQQRRIIDAVALEWDPAHSSTIVKRTGLTASSVSSQLKRLQKDGLLHQVPLGSKRKGVQIAERFYNIWYLMRHGTRRNRLRLRWLSSFLSTYYSGAELNYQAKHLISNGNASRNIYSEALMHAIDDAPLQDALRHALTRPLIGEDNECLKNLLPDEDYDPKLLDHAQRLEKMLAGFIKSGVKKDEAEKLTRMITGSISLPPEAKQWFTDNAANLSRDDIKKWINKLEAETRHLNRIIGKKTNQALGELFFAGNIASRTDTKGALAILSCNESATLIDIFLSIETFENGNIDELNRFLSHCKSTPPTTSAAWNGLGNLFQYKYKLNKYKKSENAYKKAIEINPQFASPWNGLGNLLQDHLNRFEESENAYKKAIEIDPKFAHPWNGLGNLLQNHLNRFEESENAYRKAIKIDPNYANPWNGLGNLLSVHLKRYEESEKAYKKAIEIDPQFANPWNGLGNLFQDHLNRYEESENAYKKAIEIDSNNSSSPKANLIWLKLKSKDHLKAKELASEINLPFPGNELIQATCDLVAGNPGSSCDQLAPIFRKKPASLWIEFRDDLLRLTRLVKAHQFDDFYLAFLRKNQFNLSMEPYVAATEAYFTEKDRLLRLNPEARTVAESLYGWLVSNSN